MSSKPQFGMKVVTDGSTGTCLMNGKTRSQELDMLTLLLCSKSSDNVPDLSITNVP